LVTFVSVVLERYFYKVVIIVHQTKYYNIYDIINLEIVSEKPKGLLKRLNNPLSFFEVSEPSNSPDIVLKMGKFAPSNDKCFLIDHKYHVKHNYFYCKDIQSRAKWEIEIFGLEDGATIVNFCLNTFGPEKLFLPSLLVCQEMIIKPLISYKLSKMGYYLLHAGGVSKDNHSCILVGRGGADKTSVVLDLTTSGYDYLGDDWLAITKNQALCFPTTLEQFAFINKTKKLPNESHSSIMDKFQYFLYLQRDEHKETIKISKSADLKTMFFLLRTNGAKLSKNKLDSTFIAERLIANNFAEYMEAPTILNNNYGRFYTYMLVYSFVYPFNPVINHISHLKKDLLNIFENIDIYEILVPTFYDPNELLAIIKEGV